MFGDGKSIFLSCVVDGDILYIFLSCVACADAEGILLSCHVVDGDILYIFLSCVTVVIMIGSEGILLSCVVDGDILMGSTYIAYFTMSLRFIISGGLFRAAYYPGGITRVSFSTELSCQFFSLY
jgi:hypothetical protein